MKQKFIERKIGERFDDNGVTLEVVKEDCGCIGCYLIDKQCTIYPNNRGFCSSQYRNDNQSVIFKLVKQ